MKIKKLIKTFEVLLPLYERAVETGYVPQNLRAGFCNAAYYKLSNSSEVNEALLNNGYYKHYFKFLNSFAKLKSVYLFPTYNSTRSIEISIIPRRDFLRSEIKDLKRLLAEGYTDI